MTSPPKPGDRIGPYELFEQIGAGGFGVVFRARHVLVGRPAAIKILHTEGETDATARFIREAKIASSIFHPRLTRVFESSIDSAGRPYVAMELVEGTSLHDLIVDEGPLRLSRALRITFGILEGLAAVHEAQVIHRDIKPRNVLLRGTKPNDPSSLDEVKLVDFGISKASNSGLKSLTATGRFMGTAGFAAPEQYMSARTATPEADLYSAMAVLYYMLTARLPFLSTTYERLLIESTTKDPVPLRQRLAEIPVQIASVIDAGLSREPDNRCKTAGELGIYLAAAVHASGLSPDIVPPVYRLSQLGSDDVRRTVISVAAAAMDPLVTVPVAGIDDEATRAEDDDDQ